jgi:ArsR family transcriptional regulator, arsenate/arsenite/antimonite-responsive transcriptional repressor
MDMKTLAAVEALGALAHEHRLTLYRLLVEGGPDGLPAGAIAERLRIAPSSLTFHLQHLQRVGLIKQRRLSRQLIYAANFSVMNGLVAYLTENCCGSQSASCAPACEPARPNTESTRKLRRSA